MKLIAGLGNPGEKYENNRHNVGFMFVDYLVQNQNNNVKFKIDKYVFSEIIQLSPNLILIKPTTFMNNSGIAVKQTLKRLKLDVECLTIIHDDLDIPLGKFKIQRGSGPKLHNGIESIEKSLGTKDFLRIRVGIDNRQKTGPMNGETYVLQNFLLEEKKLLITEVFPEILTRIKSEIFQ